MATTKSLLSETITPAGFDTYLNAVSDTLDALEDPRVSSLEGALIPGGRLSVVTGEPVPTDDVSAAGTLYYVPYTHGIIHLYDSTSQRWEPHAIGAQISQSLTGLLTASRPHDVFIYDNAGTLTFDFVPWTSDTARATALAMQDGVFVKTGSVGYRYVGSIRSSGTGTTEDTEGFRYVFNQYNRVLRRFSWSSGSDSHTFNPGTDTFRAWNNNSSAKALVMAGNATYANGSGSVANFTPGSTGLGQIGASVNGVSSSERISNATQPLRTIGTNIQAIASIPGATVLPARVNDIFLNQRSSANANHTWDFGAVRGEALI